RQPDAAIVWIGLADAVCRLPDSTEEARLAAAKGVEISRQADTLVRYALTCQARIARKIGDSSLFEQSIKDLIADAPNCREEDSELDEQLVDCLPDNICSSNLKARYRALFASRA